MQPISILVVDDVAAFARLLADGMRERGHAVACAANGQEASGLIARLRFDIVVTDIVMPGSNGFELIDELRRVQPKARIIAMSGGGNLYSAGACLQAAEENGVDAVLQKPFGPQELEDAIAKIFRPDQRT